MRPALLIADAEGASTAEVHRAVDATLLGEIADVLDDLARLRLRSVLKAARLEVEAGDLVSADDVLAELDAMLV